MPPKKDKTTDQTLKDLLSGNPRVTRSASPSALGPTTEDTIPATTSMDKTKSPSKGANRDNTDQVEMLTNKSNQKDNTDIPIIDEPTKYDNITLAALNLNKSRHTIVPEGLVTNNAEQDEPTSIPIDRISSKVLLEYKVHPYTEEEDLPNFYNATAALHNFRVMRDLMYSWTRAKHHQQTLRESLLSDQVPPGLRIKKNLEVIECTPHLKLQALQILGDAEIQLTRAILQHYDQLIPKIENDFHQIYNNMKGVNKEEKRLLSLKLVHYKNVLVKQQLARDEKKTQNVNAEDDQKNNPKEGTSTEKEQDQQFPWEQRPQRSNTNRGRGRGARGTRGGGGGRGRGGKDRLLI